MCKKLMFLISLVYLLGLSLPVSAADLVVDWPDVYIVDGTEEYGAVKCYGTIIVPAGCTLIANSRSEVDGDGDDGEGGSSYASLVVDGGTFIMNHRLDLGVDHDAYLIVQGGGSIIHTDEKIAIPDNDGGVHRLIIIEGTVDAAGVEVDDDSDRKSGVQLACSAVPGEIIAKLTTANTDEDDKWDPDYWITRDINEGKVYDYPEGSCGGATLFINDLGDDVKEVFYLVVGPKAWNPGPEDGAIHQAAADCNMVLEWGEGTCLALGTGNGLNIVYFSDDGDLVESQPTIPDSGWDDEPAYIGEFINRCDCRASWDVGTLPMWTKYYWRVDQGCGDATSVRGDVWSFTTGCDLTGDTNLDCIVNFLDYAAVASTWMGEQYFPAPSG